MSQDMKSFLKAGILVCLLPLLLALTPLPLVVGLPDTQLFPQYWNLSGKADGYLPRILQRFASDTGIHLELKAQPIRRYYVEFKEGRLDFLAPSNPAWAERSSPTPIVYSNPFMKSRAGFIGTRPELQPVQIKLVTTLAGYTISFLNDPKGPFKGVKVNYVNDVNSAMKVLASGRTDLIYLHYDAAREWMRLNTEGRTQTQYFFHEKYSEEFDYCLATIRHPKIIESFNRWLRENPKVLDEVKASMLTSKYP
jgi:ABC-type amino acid transport substrate-binding protein